MPIRVLRNRAISGLKELRVALPVPIVLTQPQDLRRMRDAVSLPRIAVAGSRIQKPGEEL